MLGKFFQHFKSLLVVFSVIIGFFVFFLVKETYKNYKVDKEIENLKTQMEFFKKENEELTNLINYLKTNDYIEREARVKFGMNKHGENTVMIKKNSTSKIKTDSNITNDLGMSNIEKWRLYFWGK